MALKQDFAKQIENQIAVWQAQVGEYQERLGQAGAGARADYEKAVATMRENVERANKLLAQVREAQEGAWKDCRTLRGRHSSRPRKAGRTHWRASAERRAAARCGAAPQRRPHLRLRLQRLGQPPGRGSALPDGRGWKRRTCPTAALAPR